MSCVPVFLELTILYLNMYEERDCLVRVDGEPDPRWTNGQLLKKAKDARYDISYTRKLVAWLF